MLRIIALSNIVSNVAKQQRTIIDYDEDREDFVIRSYPMEYEGKTPELVKKQTSKDGNEPRVRMTTMTAGTDLPEGAIKPLPKQRREGGEKNEQNRT